MIREKGKKLEEYIELYNRKADSPFEHDPRYQLFFNPEHGFCEIANVGSMIIAGQLCGDIKFWRNAIEEVARVSGINTCGTFCVRHIKPYIRAAGFKIEKEEPLEIGFTRYYCIDPKTGQKATCSPGFKDAKGNIAHYVTWKVSNRERGK